MSCRLSIAVALTKHTTGQFSATARAATLTARPTVRGHPHVGLPHFWVHSSGDRAEPPRMPPCPGGCLWEVSSVARGAGEARGGRATAGTFSGVSLSRAQTRTRVAGRPFVRRHMYPCKAAWCGSISRGRRAVLCRVACTGPRSDLKRRRRPFVVALSGGKQKREGEQRGTEYGAARRTTLGRLVRSVSHPWSWCSSRLSFSYLRTHLTSHWERVGPTTMVW